MVVPHTGHVPFVAGFPFFMVIGFGSFISTFFLSLRQYPSTAITSLYDTQDLRQRSPTRRIVAAHSPQFNSNSPHLPWRGGRARLDAGLSRCYSGSDRRSPPSTARPSATRA